MIDYKLNTIGNGTTAPWFAHEEDIIKIVIGEGVTTIGKWAFSDCHEVVEVSLPNTLVTIYNRAFSDCRALRSITIPNSVATIWDYAFGSESVIE